MQAVKEILDQTMRFLEERKRAHPRFLAERMLMHVLNIGRFDLYMNFDRPLEKRELDLCRSYLTRLTSHEPWQYIEGRVNFLDLELKVTPAVLIPRPETEWWVDLLIKKISGKGRLLDLCTGSGCIGLAVKKAHPKLEVTLLDIDAGALAVAEENAKKNGLEVRLLQGDLFEPVQGEQFDVIVANPPYVTDNEYLTLDSNVRLFEPECALKGGSDGLYFYKRIASEYKKYLPKTLWLEIGASQGEALLELFKKQGSLMSDLQGKERVFTLDNQ